jgi:hypothetical protein
LPEEELNRRLADVDVICCLRHPCLEGGSASLITAFLCARPTLVSHGGHYADLPDDVVLRCEAGREAANIVRHLERIQRDPEAARALGLRGRSYALEVHSPGAYAQRLLEILPQAISRRPTIQAARRLGAQLSWIGAGPGDQAAGRIGTILDTFIERSAPERI